MAEVQEAAAGATAAVCSVLDEEADPADLKMYEELCSKHETSNEEVPSVVLYQYAVCLARTTSDENLTTASKMLEDLFKKSSDKGFKRDALYYLAVASAKLKNYDEALKYCDGLLYVQPDDVQAADLKKEIDRRMVRDGLMGVAVIAGVGAAAFGGLATVGLALGKAAIGGILSLGIAFTKRR